jgi:GT2 family glycosyltransferase
VTWIASDRNLGFGSGCNRGAAVATQDLLIFLNPDTLVSEDTFPVMWELFQKQPDLGVAGCKIVNRDGSLQLACKRSFPSPSVAAYKLVGLGSLFPKSRVFGRYNLTFLDENQTHEVDAVSGSFLSIRADLFSKIGGFDEEFFMYGEDLDICFRAKLEGRRNIYHPKTSVIHFKGESAKSRPFRSFLYFYEAMVIFSKKHLELRILPLALLNLGVLLLALANFGTTRFRKWPRWAADLILVNGILATVTAAYQRYLQMPQIFTEHWQSIGFWHLLVTMALLIPMTYLGEYWRPVAKARSVALYSGIGFLAFFTLSFFFKEQAYSRVVFGLTGVISMASLVGWRLLANHGGRLLRKIMGSVRRTAIVGTDERAQLLAELIQDEKLDGYEFVGFIQYPPGRPPRDVSPNVIGDLLTLENLVKKMDLQSLIIAVEERAYPTALQILAQHVHGPLEVKMLVGPLDPTGINLINLNFHK